MRDNTATPSRLGKKELYQLLGYALLDYDDEYGIQRLGFYGGRSYGSTPRESAGAPRIRTRDRRSRITWRNSSSTPMA
ncbi:MAG TPA: hypothetical protein VGG75_34475 [Trebonia sp.]|jgi:hypothetical protein